MNKQEYLVSVLAEECCEVGQACSKINRFGMIDSVKDRDNSARLVEELNDLMGSIGMLVEEGYISNDWFNVEAISAKMDKIKHYMQHSVDNNCLQLDLSEDQQEDEENIEEDVDLIGSE